MSDDEKSPQQLVVDTIWTYAGWLIVILACIGAGVFIGHAKWGDAEALRAKVGQYEKQVLSLKNERETLNTRIAKLTQERDTCQKSSPTGAVAAPAAKGAPASTRPDGIVVE